MTASPEKKAAPIPAELRQRLIEGGADSVALALAKGVTERIGRSDWSLLTNLIHCAIIDGAAILADREARPSLPDSREEPPLTCPEIDRILAAHPELADELEGLRNSNSQLRYGLWHEKARADMAERKLADRASQEEQIREDERDRLLVLASAWHHQAETFLLDQGAMDFADRARAHQGGNNG